MGQRQTKWISAGIVQSIMDAERQESNLLTTKTVKNMYWYLLARLFNLLNCASLTIHHSGYNAVYYIYYQYSLKLCLAKS